MFHGFKGSSPWPPRFVEVWSQRDNTRGKDQSTPSEGAFFPMGVAGKGDLSRAIFAGERVGSSWYPTTGNILNDAVDETLLYI